MIRRAERSWWMEEALADPELAGEPAPPLARDTEADVVVLGGGYTGMWTAGFLKEREPGLDVVLLERDICGSGPSGRNGGFCNGFWEDLDTLVELFGVARALELCRAAERSIQDIGAWCEAHDVDAWYAMSGHLGVATSEAQDGAWRDWYALMVRLAVDDGRIEQLTAAQVAERCRSPRFGGGVRTDAAMLQPARLARGLRRELQRVGVRVYEGTPVLRFRGRPRVEAQTPGGTVRAGRAILGMGAYMASLTTFRRMIVPRGTYIVLTEPIPERLEHDLGWTGGEGVYDFRTALRYLRTTRDGRIAFGSAAAVTGLGVGLGPRLDFDERSVAWIARDLVRFFPSLRDVRIECAWGGPMDVTGWHVPSFGTLRGGRVHFGVGYAGGGVGPCHLGGQILSGLALGIEDEHTRLPLVGLEPKRFPPEPLRSPGVTLVQKAVVRRDQMLDRGRRPNVLVDLVASLPRRLGYKLGP